MLYLQEKFNERYSLNYTKLFILLKKKQIVASYRINKLFNLKKPVE